MDIRPFMHPDLPELIDLTIATFGAFYENSFRPLVGEAMFSHQHGSWRDDYQAQVPALHDPANGRLVAIADTGESIAGYVAWNYDLTRKQGEIDILAVSVEHRRQGIGGLLCRHAFADLEERGIDVVTIGTGGDPFHAPARSLYDSLGCTPLPVVVYYKQL
jgi:ribosomal protein S18 acetylase RimI-like enzyme